MGLQKIKEVMVRDTISIQSDDRVGEALGLMAENRVSAMPVVDGRDRCVGMLSVTDVVGLVRDQSFGQIEPDELARVTAQMATEAGTDIRERRVGDIMTREVVSVDPEAPVVEAAREMVRSRVHRLVVTDTSRKLLGIVSTLDLLEALSAER